MQELGVPADDLFESIDEEPLGAASIGQVHLLWLCLLWLYLLGVNTLRPAPSSFGQVHRATLHGGAEVVVKVQHTLALARTLARSLARTLALAPTSALAPTLTPNQVQYPNAKRYFATDMGTLTRFCRALYPEVVPLMREIERQFLTEFDYTREAALMRQVYSRSKYSPSRHSRSSTTRARSPSCARRPPT